MCDEEWLVEVQAAMATGTPKTNLSDDFSTFISGLRGLRNDDAGDVHDHVLFYLTHVYQRQVEAVVGNYTFWCWDRLTTDVSSAADYGADSSSLMLADWMLDSAMCAVDIFSSRMSFLGGIEPIESELDFLDFLRLVNLDPTFPHGFAK